MQSIYSLKMRLLDRQTDIISVTERGQVSMMAEYVGLFHVSWFLKCPLTSSVPSLQLQSIMHMKIYSSHNPDIANLVLKSMQNHLWHLTEQCVVTALVEDDLPDSERKLLAITLSQTTRPGEIGPGHPQFLDVIKSGVHPDRLWLSGQMPSLKSFVGPKCWLLFTC